MIIPGMLIALGSSYYGKTDHLKGLFCVATRFGYIYFLPLFPISTYCLWKIDGVMIETRIPMSGMSVLKGFLRTWLCVIGIFLLLGCLVYTGRPLVTWILGILAVLCYIFVTLTYLGQKPSPARALFLASSIGMSPERLAEQYLDDPRVEELMQRTQSK